MRSMKKRSHMGMINKRSDMMNRLFKERDHCGMASNCTEVRRAAQRARAATDGQGGSGLLFYVSLVVQQAAWHDMRNKFRTAGYRAKYR